MTIKSQIGVLLPLILAALVLVTSAHAITIATVPVGNPGNAPDTRYIDADHPSGVGAVAYSFNIGTTEVTNLQYVSFLNAVGASDPYGLYSTSMATDTVGGIVRSGSSGSFTYAIKTPAQNGAYVYDNKPVVLVSWGDSVRFVNWLHNGQPTGAESASTTEDGAYTLNGATTDSQLIAVTRNSGARWWLPNENEWYKAAYHKNDGVTADYWNYPTRTNTAPNNQLPANDTGNSANYNFGGGAYTTGNASFPLTDVGAYALSKGPYGTFDQGGNVKEWDETRVSGPGRAVRGGGWNFFGSYLNGSVLVPGQPTGEANYAGFRVASSPAAVGDFDGNGRVDATDYIVWRKNNGSAADYNLWRAYFDGSAAASGSSIENASIPEPSSLALLFGVAFILLVASERAERKQPHHIKLPRRVF